MWFHSVRERGVWFHTVREGCGFIDEDIVLVQLHSFNHIKKKCEMSCFPPPSQQVLHDCQLVQRLLDGDEENQRQR